MNIYSDTLEMASWDVTLDSDLATATVAVYLAGAWQAATWAGAATSSGGTWTRKAQLLVAGANQGSGVKPTADDKYPLVKVTVGGETIVRKSKSILTVA